MWLRGASRSGAGACTRAHPASHPPRPRPQRGIRGDPGRLALVGPLVPAPEVGSRDRRPARPPAGRAPRRRALRSPDPAAATRQLRRRAADAAHRPGARLVGRPRLPADRRRRTDAEPALERRPRRLAPRRRRAGSGRARARRRRRDGPRAAALERPQPGRCDPLRRLLPLPRTGVTPAGTTGPIVIDAAWTTMMFL